MRTSLLSTSPIAAVTFIPFNSTKWLLMNSFNNKSQYKLKVKCEITETTYKEEEETEETSFPDVNYNDIKNEFNSLYSDDYIQSNSIKEMNSVELQEEIKKCLYKAIELTKSYHVKIIKKKHKYLQMKVEYVCYANRFLKLNWKYQKLVQNVQVHDLVCNMMRPLLRKEEYLNNIKKELEMIRTAGSWNTSKEGKEEKQCHLNEKRNSVFCNNNKIMLREIFCKVTGYHRVLLSSTQVQFVNKQNVLLNHYKKLFCKQKAYS